MSPLLLKRLSDELLGSRLASGEAAAFDELYRRYVHRLSAYGANLLGDAASGDDVAQSALLKAYGALRAGRVPTHLKPWLFRIAHNAAIDLVARRRELPSAELPERPAGGGEPAERSGALVAALAALPDRQRRVYVLRELHGLRIDETAAELGLTAAQVEQSLFVARNRMAEHLVFGNRLNCVAVQKLTLGPLERDERRALKTHLRSCATCRATLGLRGRALGLLPAAPLDWLRGLVAAAAGGGAPVAAKVGAVVASASLAAGVPVTADQVFQHPRPIAPRVVAQAPRPSSALAAEPALQSPAPVTVAPLSAWHVTRPVVHAEDSADRRGAHVRSSADSRDGGGQRTEPSSNGADSGGGSGGDGTGDGGEGTSGGSRPVSISGSGPAAAQPASTGGRDGGDTKDGGGSGRSPASTPTAGTGQTGAGDQPTTTTTTTTTDPATTTTDQATTTTDSGGRDGGGSGGDGGGGGGSGDSSTND